MGDTCEICKKNPAKISIGNHSYCFDCHNKMALHDMGIDDSFTYAKNMSVIEPNGKIHTFEIEHVVLGGIVSWEANEKDGEYRFRLISQKMVLILHRNYFVKLWKVSARKHLKSTRESGVHPIF